MRTSVALVPVALLLLAAPSLGQVVHTATASRQMSVVCPEPWQTNPPPCPDFAEWPAEVGPWSTVLPSSRLELRARGVAHVSISAGQFPQCGNVWQCSIDVWAEARGTGPNTAHRWALAEDDRSGTFGPSGSVGVTLDATAEGSFPLGDFVHLPTAHAGALPIAISAYPGCDVCDEGYNAAINTCWGYSAAAPMTSFTSEATIVVEHVPAQLPSWQSWAGYCPSAANSTGRQAELVFGGSSSLADDALFASVEHLPPGSLGFLLMSNAQANVPGFGGGQGTLCLGAPILRFSAHVQRATPQGHVAYRVPLSSLPQGQPIAPGQTWHFQFWFRDANPAVTHNTSWASEVTFQ